MADYAISNVARRVVYTNTGVGPYSFTFEILANTDIAVYRGSTLLTLTTDYSVTINANGTGSITLVTAGTGNITIVGARAIQRTSDYTTGGDLFASTLNTDLDSQTIYAQQVAETAERGLKAPVVDPTDINMTLPAKATRAGTVLAFNATTGNPEAGPSIASVTTVAAQSANINTVATNIASVNTVAGNISNVNTVAGVSSNVTTVAGISANVTTVAGNSANVSTVAGISGNVTTVAGISANVTTVAGIDSDVTAVAADATDIGAVASNIANVNTVAGNSTNINTVAGISANVTTVAGISSNVTTVAGVSAGVTTVAGISANVTTVAGISANVTIAATNVADINNFADVYQGAKATDPSLRNDGSALQSGDLYFNTTDDVMKVREAGAWLAAYASVSGALIAANNLSDLTNKTTARQNLDLEIGVDVQAYDAQLADVAGLSPADNNFIVGNGTNFVAESGSTARTSLGLGSIATQDSSNVTVTGGSINGTTVGGTTAAAGKFTTLEATGVATVSAGSVSAPAITTTGDTNTGVFFPAADTIAFSEGGAESMRIDSSGNVGIGTSSPATRLNIADSGGGVSLQFNGYTGGQNIQAKIECERPNFNNFESQLRFYTHNGSSLAEKMRIDQNGNLLFNSGYGSVATAYGCRAWVNFDGTGTPAIRGSGNVSSITDNGTGAYTVNFSTAMPDANYCTNATGTHDGGSYVAWGTVANDTPPTTSAVRTDFLNDAGSPTDVSFAQVSIIR